ncbi:SixA phosphatase family protein [Marinobacterium sp. YM272]|uniref:SixA phosphatase family protein n=1 Tax=Marinobacterium sp. YM272 TaxID=3421654 RepID=UPI003D7F878B
MRLLLMRHSEAVPGRDDDPDRALTEAGRLLLAEPDQSLAQALSEVSLVLSSPWRRARETAELLLPQTCSDTVRSVEELLPFAAPKALLPILEEFAYSRQGASSGGDSGEAGLTVLAVGHQPLVGRLAALLCEGANAHPWTFAPAELAVIELDWPAGGLGWLRRWHCWQP